MLIIIAFGKLNNYLFKVDHGLFI